MFCKKCYNQIQQDAAFCPKCGAPTNDKTGVQTDGFVDSTLQEQHGHNHPPIPLYGGYSPIPIEPASGLATASLVMGIIGLAIGGPLFGILGLIFSIVARSKGNKSGRATAGLVLSIICLVIWGMIIACVVFVFMQDLGYMYF